MDTGQALTRFFQRDSTKAKQSPFTHTVKKTFGYGLHHGDYYNDAVRLGFDDTGYDLPPLDVRQHIIKDTFDNLPTDRDGQIMLMRQTSKSLSDAAAEKRNSINKRVQKMMEIINEDPNETFILWHDLEAERHAIKKALPKAVEIYGKMDYEEREKRTIDFSEGRVKYLLPKKNCQVAAVIFKKALATALFSSALTMNSMILFRPYTAFTVFAD